MDQDKTNPRLSDISTVWSVLRQAHAGSAEAVAAAQQLLLQRYGGAVRRYLLAALRDPDAADDLTQEFALCLVRGEFRRAEPGRGRFRNSVKAVLFHLVSRHRKRQRSRAQPLPPDAPELAGVPAPPEGADGAFRDAWREQLLARAWEALAAAQPTYFAALRCRASHARLPSPRLAEHLSRATGKPFTADGARQALHRARAKFAELLLDEVAQSLEAPTAEEVEQELRDLDLLAYCQTALGRKAPGP
jgi:RNA polymerase sigma-70 factor (ECF subfamily)